MGSKFLVPFLFFFEVKNSEKKMCVINNSEKLQFRAFIEGGLAGNS